MHFQTWNCTAKLEIELSGKQMLSKSPDFSFLNPIGPSLLTGGRTGSFQTSLSLLLFDLALPIHLYNWISRHPCCVNQLSPKKSYWLFASALAYQGCSGGSHLSVTSLGCCGVEWYICPNSGIAIPPSCPVLFSFARWSFTHNFKGWKKRERKKNPININQPINKTQTQNTSTGEGKIVSLSTKSNEEILLSVKVFITSAKLPCGCRFMVQWMAKAGTKPDFKVLGNVLLCFLLFWSRVCGGGCWCAIGRKSVSVGAVLSLFPW